MKAKRVNREEQLKLIMECRSSGLSDYQWCETHGIHAGTFYNWVSKLRKAGVTKSFFFKNNSLEFPGGAVG